MVRKIKLEEGKNFKDFMEENTEQFWEMVVETAIKLHKNDLDKCVVFILYGGNLHKEQEYVVNKENLPEVIEKSLSKMEEYEKYEICSELLKIKKDIE